MYVIFYIMKKKLSSAWKSNHPKADDAEPSYM